MKKILRHSRKGFTLIELLVGMTIFSLGITSIFVLLQSTMRSANISRNEVIVANLLREQTELLQNIRNNNYTIWASWKLAKIDGNQASQELQEGTFLIENDFSQTQIVFDANNGGIQASPVKITKITDFSPNETQKDIFDKTQLCLNTDWFYVHCDANNQQNKTAFASYLLLKPLAFTDATGNTVTVEKTENNQNLLQGFIVDARVLVRDGSHFREYDAKTAITDWQ